MIKLIKSTFYHEAETKAKLTDFIGQADILSMGVECQKFETAFAAKHDRRYALFVSSGSMANLVLIQAMMNLGRLKKGDKVGFSVLTWATNIMPLIQLGLEPVAIDCELDTLNVSPELLAPHLKDIKALFLTNVLGFCDELEEVRRLCDEQGIVLLEDNCESLGSKAYGTLLGNFGVASTFSFFVGHHMSTIEGGMICTDDEALYDMLKMVRAHGWDRNLEPEKQQQLRTENHVNDFLAKYVFYDLAYNARPTEINGFLGNVQLPYLDEIVNKRSANFQRFHEAVSVNDDFHVFAIDHMDRVSNFAMPVICKDEATAEKYKTRFTEAEVEIRPVIAGDMTQQPFYKKYAVATEHCVNAATIHKTGFYFGNNPELTDDELDTLAGLLRK